MSSDTGTPSNSSEEVSATLAACSQSSLLDGAPAESGLRGATSPLTGGEVLFPNLEPRLAKILCDCRAGEHRQAPLKRSEPDSLVVLTVPGLLWPCGTGSSLASPAPADHRSLEHEMRLERRRPYGHRQRPVQARRVLPTPPMPVRVTSRLAESNARTSESSLRRPTKLVNSGGRFPVRSRSAVAGRAHSSAAASASHRLARRNVQRVDRDELE